MKWFIIITLVLALIIALVQINEKTSQDGRKKYITKRILPWLFIFSFVISVIVALYQYNENKKLNDLTEDISKKTKKIDSISSLQIDILNDNIGQTLKIINSIDSIQKNSSELLLNEQTLLSQYQSVNERLKKQIEIDYSNLKSNKATIELFDKNINWEYATDSSLSLRLCISNVGGRTAEILSSNGYILFFDRNSKPLDYLKIPNNHIKTFLSPIKLLNAPYCIYSFSVLNSMDQLKSNSNFAIINLNISYRDIVLESLETKEFYKLWNPKDDEFGGPRDWHIKLYNDWFNENIR